MTLFENYLLEFQKSIKQEGYVNEDLESYLEMLFMEMDPAMVRKLMKSNKGGIKTRFQQIRKAKMGAMNAGKMNKRSAGQAAGKMVGIL